MRRSVDVEELLDGPLDDPAALGGNLRDLERVNRWLGGTALSAHGIDALAGDRESLTILDIGTGAADIPLALLARSARAGRRLRVTGIDSRPEVLAAAVVRRPALGATAGLELHVGDGRSLPFPDRSFDIAHASLLVHHLDPTAAVALLREMGSRRAARDRRQRPPARPWRLARGVAVEPPGDEEPLHPPRRSVVRQSGVHGERADLAGRGRRPARRIGAARWAVPASAGPGGDRRVDRRNGRSRERRGSRVNRPASTRADVAIVGGGLAGCALAVALARRRRRGRRARAAAGLALAGRGRVQLPGRSRRAAARRARRRGPAPRRATHPGDAPRDPGWRRGPVDVRRRGRRPDRCRLRPVGARSGAGRAGGRCRGGGPARTRGRDASTSMAAARSLACAVPVDPRRSTAGSSSGRMARTRSSRVPRGSRAQRGSPSGSASPTTWRIRGRTGRCDARLRVFDGGYIGVAPVPGGRVNIGIVLGPAWRDGSPATVRSARPSRSWRPSRPHPTTRPRGGAPNGAITSQERPRWAAGSCAGRGPAGSWSATPWGSSTRSPAKASTARSSRASSPRPRSGSRWTGRHAPPTPAGAYDRTMRRRFAAKDAVSWLVQAFLARPGPFEYAARRLATRPDVRATMGLVMGDLVPASRGLDPRFLAALLAP